MKPNTPTTHPAMMRLFIAIPLPSEMKSIIHTAMDQMKPDLPFQKWVHPEDLHITLKFIGNVPASAVPDLKAKLGQIAARSMPFGLSLKGTGTFGQPQTPSVLWARVEGNLHVLHKLQTDVEQQAAELGYAAETRAYAPHVTLARRYAGSERKGQAALRTLPDILWSENEWTVDRVTLFRTHMGQSPMYETLQDYVFYAGG